MYLAPFSEKVKVEKVSEYMLSDNGCTVNPNPNPSLALIEPRI